MANSSYIQVILPLKLEWEPFYRVDNQEVAVGDRIRVVFAGKEYVGVASAVDAQPEIDTKKILPIIAVEREMEKVFAQEIQLWRPVGFDYRTSTRLGKQTLGGPKHKLVHTRTQQKGAVTPQETEPDFPVSVQESLADAWVDSCLPQGQGHGIQQHWHKSF